LEFELWRAHLALQPGIPFPQRYVPCYRTAIELAAFGPALGAASAGAPLDETDDAAHFRNAFLIREALVREAATQGIELDDEEVKRAISKGRLFIFDHGSWTDPQGGVHWCGGELPLRIGTGRSGKFEPNALRAALQQQFQMSVDDFYAFQRRNLLALKMQQLLAAAVAVSPAEVEQAVRMEAEAVDVLVWTVAPAVGTDEDAASLQSKFDLLRGQIADGELDVWLAQEANGRRADERARAAAPAVPEGFDPASGRREIARSLLAVERLSQEVEGAARIARASLAQPGEPPAEPPPTLEGLAIRSHTEQLRPLAPASELPPTFAERADVVPRILALTEAAPMLDEDLTRESTIASVTDATGERYAVQEVSLVRRTGPWNLEEAVQQALTEKREAVAAALLAGRRARLLEAWYATRLFDARARDEVDDQRLVEYLDAIRQESE
ncbi:MAG: hypothetical protein JXB32_05245, partial [Deltaproteobacteria bacterium]|nr:hypothetical protein [Deltaproteobacteria bacterium]